jgi:hypothetical protein
MIVPMSIAEHLDRAEEILEKVEAKVGVIGDPDISIVDGIALANLHVSIARAKHELGYYS